MVLFEAPGSKPKTVFSEPTPLSFFKINKRKKAEKRQANQLITKHLYINSPSIQLSICVLFETRLMSFVL